MFYPAGFMDVVQIEKTKENFRLLYTTKKRYHLQKIGLEEAAYKLCRVRKLKLGLGATPYAIRYPDPAIRVGDTIRWNFEKSQMEDFVKFELGNVAMMSGGNNTGRVGIITHREKHPGSFEIVHLKDAAGNTWATRRANVFVLGPGNKPWVSLPRGNGVKLNIIEDRQIMMNKSSAKH